MDQIAKDARRLASIGTFFIVAGWVFVVYALIAGVLWWIDLAQREAFNIVTSLAISATAVGLPVFAAILVTSAVSLVLYWVVGLVRRATIPWAPGVRREVDLEEQPF